MTDTVANRSGLTTVTRPNFDVESIVQKPSSEIFQSVDDMLKRCGDIGTELRAQPRSVEDGDQDDLEVKQCMREAISKARNAVTGDADKEYVEQILQKYIDDGRKDEVMDMCYTVLRSKDLTAYQWFLQTLQLIGDVVDLWNEDGSSGDIDDKEQEVTRRYEEYEKISQELEANLEEYEKKKKAAEIFQQSFQMNIPVDAQAAVNRSHEAVTALETRKNKIRGDVLTQYGGIKVIQHLNMELPRINERLFKTDGDEMCARYYRKTRMNVKCNSDWGDIMCKITKEPGVFHDYVNFLHHKMCGVVELLSEIGRIPLVNDKKRPNYDGILEDLILREFSSVGAVRIAADSVSQIKMLLQTGSLQLPDIFECNVIEISKERNFTDSARTGFVIKISKACNSTDMLAMHVADEWLRIFEMNKEDIKARMNEMSAKVNATSKAYSDMKKGMDLISPHVDADVVCKMEAMLAHRMEELDKQYKLLEKPAKTLTIANLIMSKMGTIRKIINALKADATVLEYQKTFLRRALAQQLETAQTSS